jgi:hypothetical protein
MVWPGCGKDGRLEPANSGKIEFPNGSVVSFFLRNQFFHFDAIHEAI